MVLAMTLPGGLTDTCAAWGDLWVRIAKHIKTPAPNAWSKSLAKLEEEEQPTTNENRKPAGALWADADDGEGDDDMDNPWGTANADDWNKYGRAMADQTWPSSGPAGGAPATTMATNHTTSPLTTTRTSHHQQTSGHHHLT